MLKMNKYSNAYIAWYIILLVDVKSYSCFIFVTIGQMAMYFDNWKLNIEQSLKNENILNKNICDIFINEVLMENEELFEGNPSFKTWLWFLKNIKQFVKNVYVKENLETT